ncbi:hypothetical protein AB0758_32865 [Tolypothrix bouteillei VB521301_2]|uniref:hypothetical protein n=1 Tax=Tolypothrix bouteillei TaxID=1246981 RepID=UPI0038B66D82
MKALLKRMAMMLPATGLVYLGINFPPALASVACLSGTATNYSSHSLAGCVLSRNAEIRVNNSRFFCKEGQPIYFTEKGIFSSCVLSEPIEIRRSTGVEVCPTDAKVSFAISTSKACAFMR